MDKYAALGKDPRYECAATLGGLFGGVNGAVQALAGCMIMDILNGEYPAHLSIYSYFQRYYGDGTKIKKKSHKTTR